MTLVYKYNEEIGIEPNFYRRDRKQNRTIISISYKVICIQSRNIKYKYENKYWFNDGCNHSSNTQ